MRLRYIFFMTRNGYSYRFVRPISWRVRLIGWTIETDLCFVVVITEFQGHRLHIHSATGCYCMCFLLVLRWWQPSVSIHLSLMFHMAPVLLNHREVCLSALASSPEAVAAAAYLALSVPLLYALCRGYGALLLHPVFGWQLCLVSGNVPSCSCLHSTHNNWTRPCSLMWSPVGEGHLCLVVEEHHLVPVRHSGTLPLLSCKGRRFCICFSPEAKDLCLSFEGVIHLPWWLRW